MSQLLKAKSFNGKLPTSNIQFNYDKSKALYDRLQSLGIQLTPKQCYENVFRASVVSDYDVLYAFVEFPNMKTTSGASLFFRHCMFLDGNQALCPTLLLTEKSLDNRRIIPIVLIKNEDYMDKFVPQCINEDGKTYTVSKLFAHEKDIEKKMFQQNMFVVG